MIFCPDLKYDEAISFAERLREKFAALVINPECALTLSIGIAGTGQVRPLNATTILEAADKAVYEAKETGKNKVVHYKNLNEACALTS